MIERQLEVKLTSRAATDRDPVVLGGLDLPAEQGRVELCQPLRIIRVEHHGLEADSGDLRLSRSVRAAAFVSEIDVMRNILVVALTL